MLGPISPGGSGSGTNPELEGRVETVEYKVDVLENDRQTGNPGQVWTQTAEGPTWQNSASAPTGERRLVSATRIETSGSWDRDAKWAEALAEAQTIFGEDITEDDLVMDVEIIGGGSSGASARTATAVGPGQGGNAGSVRRVTNLRKADLTSSVAIVIGAGGVGQPAYTWGSHIGAGGYSLFGDYRAPGGPGQTLESSVLYHLYPSPSDVPVGLPGLPARAGNQSGIRATESFGPGCGGGGGYYQSGGGWGHGGNGGNGGAGTDANLTLGGLGGRMNDTSGDPTRNAQDGADAFDAFSYGAGGGGGAGSGSFAHGGDGGAPGGGGGGAALVSSSSGGTSGAGGRGEVRVFFYYVGGA